uniref:RING-type E3 ubiquitin transferase n=1 Tax=Haemonchus placei TaxID=6290 RepID=A0A0N4W2P2_HAEPC
LITKNDGVIAGSPAARPADMEGLLGDLYTTSLDRFGAITSDGKMIFLEEGVRVDSKTYLKGVLEKEDMDLSAGLNSSTQLQNGTGLVRNALPRPHLVGQLAPKQTAPNPLYHSVWSVLKTKAYSTKHRSLDAPRATPVEAWEDPDKDYLRVAVDASPRSISACIRKDAISRSRLFL